MDLKKVLKILKKYLWLIVSVLVVGGIGFIGFRQTGCVSPSDAVFHVFQMFFLNYSFDDTPVNCCLQIARFAAPLVTFAGFRKGLVNFANFVRTHAKTAQLGSIAVYAPEETAARLVKRLAERGENGVVGGSEFLSADTYILYNDSAWNARFLSMNREDLKNRQVYLRTDTLPAHSVSSRNLHLFSPAEIVARDYWKTCGLLRVAAEQSYRCEVVLLGFGALGEQLLYWGLQDNVFSPDQLIRYHIFGDAEEFLSAHPYLREIGDPVIPHADGWLDHLDLLRGASLVLVLPEASDAPAQEKTVYQLLSLLPGKKLVAFTEEPTLLSELDKRVKVIDMTEDPLDPKLIMGDELIEHAMRINLRYLNRRMREKGKTIEESPENRRAEWDKLSTFLRYSNIGAADYHEIRKQLLEQRRVAPTRDAIDAETWELLEELEHMRWCRFYWLNNWRWGDPKNGETNDPDRRVHMDLLPYHALPDSELHKDREIIEVMLELK